MIGASQKEERISFSALQDDYSGRLGIGEQDTRTMHTDTPAWTPELQHSEEGDDKL